MMPNQFSNPDRRQFLTSSGLGAGAIALHSLLAEQTVAGSHHAATARSVIFLFMSGGPSQVDTFDPKPELARLAGKDVPDSLARLVPRIKRAGLRNLMGSPWEFPPRGDSEIRTETKWNHVFSFYQKDGS